MNKKEAIICLLAPCQFCGGQSSFFDGHKHPEEYKGDGDATIFSRNPLYFRIDWNNGSFIEVVL